MSHESLKPLIIGGLVAAAVIYIYPLYLPTPLLEPDEGLHATISQEMVERDEWIVPTFRGEPFLDKPILYFWAQMASLKTFGMTEFAVRLPGLTAGLFGALTTGLLAGRLFGLRVGILACLASMTMTIPLALAQAAVHDVALVPWTNLAMLSLWETERAFTTRRRYLWLAGAACMFGLAMLTKALIGVAVIGVGYGLFLICSGTLSFGRCARVGLAIIVGAVLASPWFIAMEFQIPGYAYYYFVERHVMGFATSTQRHGHQPWFFYLPFVTLGAIPWVWYIVPMLRDEWHNRSKRSQMLPQMIFVVCWLVGGLVFLSVAKSKLVPYALPVFPSVAILCALAWHRRMTGRMSDVATRWFAGIIRAAGAAGVIFPFGILLACGLILGTAWEAKAWLLAVAVSGLSVTAWRTFETQRFHSTVGLLCVWVAGIVCLVMTWPLQMFAENHSERSLAQWMNRQQQLPEHLILVGEKPASVLFYLSKDLRRKLSPRRVESVELNQLSSGTQLAPGTVLAVTHRKLAEARTEHQSIPGTFTETVGQFQLFRTEDDFHSLALIAGRPER
ncbi:MAG: glycosyltransferase family 39 protein [Planctomycetaceae bacterium]